MWFYEIIEFSGAYGIRYTLFTSREKRDNFFATYPCNPEQTDCPAKARKWDKLFLGQNNVRLYG